MRSDVSSIKPYLTFHFPPTKDEYFYGYLQGLMRRSGRRNLKCFRDFLMGQSSLKVDISRELHPQELAGLEKITQEDYSPTNISSLTLFPYFRPFLKMSLQNIFVQQWSEGRLMSKPISRLDKAMSDEIKYCEDCRKENYGTHGRSIWLRAHQLPGVLACWKHEKPLYRAPASLQKLILPEEAEIRGIRLVQEVNDEWLWLARSSRELLNLNLPFYRDEVHDQIYDSWKMRTVQEPIWRSCWSESVLELLNERYPDLNFAGHSSRSSPTYGRLATYLLPLKRILTIRVRGGSIAEHFKKCGELEALPA